MSETIARQMVGLCPQCQKMMFLGEDLKTYCLGCSRPEEECYCFVH